MYDIIWNMLQTGNYDLEDVVHKINVLWVEGQLTKNQRDDLLDQALEHLDPGTQRPETLAMLQSLAERMTAVESRVDALEGKTPDPDAYPDWVPWDGLSSDYQYGAIVAHDGKLWVSRHAGQNTWEPGSDVSNQMGLWVEYTPEEEDTDA